jgi:competence protein ComEA
MFRTLLTLAAAALIAFVASVSPVAAQTAAPKAPAASAKASSAIVNLNTATAADLQTLPGIGAKTAERILDYRQKNGPFKKIEELMNIRGVGEKNFLKLKNQITVSPAKSDGK